MKRPRVDTLSRPGEVGLSRREIAERLGISRSRVQQIEAKALDKLRRLLAREGFVVEDMPWAP